MQIYDRYASYDDSLARLTRLQERPQTVGIGSAAPPGSPFLEGRTATVASAMLLQRLTGAVTAAGGSVISSEVEQGRAQTKEGYLKVVSSLEIRQGALQRLLHDLEAGMPFLFIEQLLVQTTTNPVESDRLRVRLAVSGLWRGGR
jgi:general secretion pathway protein M